MMREFNAVVLGGQFASLLASRRRETELTTKPEVLASQL
jgi:hypothetical protein